MTLAVARDRPSPWLAIVARRRSWSTAVPAVLNLAGFAELALFVLIIAGVAGGRRGPRRSRRSSWRGYLVLAVFLILGAIIYHFLHPDTGLPPGAAGTAPTPWARRARTAPSGWSSSWRSWSRSRCSRSCSPRAAAGRPRRPEQGPAPDDSDFQVEGPGLGWLRRARARLFGERTPTPAGQCRGGLRGDARPARALARPAPAAPGDAPGPCPPGPRGGQRARSSSISWRPTTSCRAGAHGPCPAARRSGRSVAGIAHGAGSSARIQAEEAARQHAEERAGKDREEA